jgi:hypothetical protein
MKYVGNCPVRSITLYQLMGSDKTIIEDSIKKLRIYYVENFF